MVNLINMKIKIAILLINDVVDALRFAGSKDVEKCAICAKSNVDVDVNESAT